VKALIKWEEIWTFINVNGVKVAFTEAQKAQVENKRVLDSFLWIWKSGNNPWLIKGVDTQVNVNYDSTGIKSIPILNMTLNWDTEAESVKRVSDHVY
jgi:hypothetical protein